MLGYFCQNKKEEYMKKLNHLIYLLLAALLVMGCSDDDSSGSSLSQTNFNDLSHEETTVKVSLQTGGEWTATCMATWCSVDQAKGTGNAELSIAVEANVGNERTGTVKIWTPGQVFTITLHQQAMPSDAEYHYKLPVIFHVLYADANDENQYIPQSRLAEVLQAVNAYYRGETIYPGGETGVDMNLEFVLTDTDETGNALGTPGVEYIKVDAMPIDCSEFMADEKNVKLLWDPNRYINIMLYNFATEPESNSVTLGISHLPFTSKSNSLEGLPTVEYDYLIKENLPFPKCVSINSLFAYEDFREEPGYKYGYNGSNVKVTLAHELGHYLGLYHAFDEGDDGGLSALCIDSDYCPDTPSYNREAYWANMMYLFQEAEKKGESISMKVATARENCKTGETFNSYNLMDYEISYGDRLTPDQRYRIRHVLSYGLLTPGPKQNKADTRSAPAGKLDLPMVIVK